jgi:sulfite reductase beta subunit-like hemoprotein
VLAGELLNRVPQARIAAALAPLLAAWRDGRKPAEGFGDWCRRTGLDTLRGLAKAT